MMTFLLESLVACALFTLFVFLMSRNPIDNWATEWAKIESIALKVCPTWTNEPLQAELRLAAEGNHAVRHSEAFRNTYHPHYRIVK